MKNHLLSNYFRLRATALLGAACLLLGSPAHFAAAQSPAKVPAANIYPVLIDASGHLTDLYFMAGQSVRRGQVLAKVERPDGSPHYINAPATGYITASRLSLGGVYLPLHTVLATVEVRTRPAVVCR